jgi:hypothetical protein
MLIEHKGRVIIEDGVDDPPYRCPLCGMFFAFYPVKQATIRCPSVHCNHSGAKKEFEVQYAEVAKARVLVAKT